MKPDRRDVCTTANRPGFKGTACPVCGKPLTKKDRIVIWEIRQNWFRGDDHVYASHLKCESKLGPLIESLENKETES